MEGSITPYGGQPTGILKEEEERSGRGRRRQRRKQQHRLDTHMASKRKSRKTYPADFKVQVAKYAAKNGNRQTSRKFGVSQRLLRAWRKAEDILKTMGQAKRVSCGLRPKWPQLEKEVQKWVLEQRRSYVSMPR